MNAIAAPGTGRRTSIAARIGLVLAALLSSLDISTGISLQSFGFDLSALAMVAVGVVTLVAIPFSWRGSAGASWTVAVSRVGASLFGLPAFFIPQLPPEAVFMAGGGIVASMLVAVLLLVRPRRVAA